jgi:hypothetical protein
LGKYRSRLEEACRRLIFWVFPKKQVTIDPRIVRKIHLKEGYLPRADRKSPEDLGY